MTKTTTATSGLEKAQCRECLQPFEFERKGRRGKELCPQCYSKLRAMAAKRWRDRGFANPSGRLAKSTLETVSNSSGVSTSTVESIERRCLAALRTDPELKRLYRDWVAAGMPRPAVTDFGMELLSHQSLVADWYELVSEMLASGDSELNNLAAQLADEVEKYQGLIARELERTHGILHTGSH